MDSLELVLTPPLSVGPAELDRIPALRAAFARGPVDVTRIDPDAWWLSRFGAPSGDVVAAGCLRMPAPEGGSFRICADPVHLSVQGDGVVLDAAAALSLSAADAASLVACLEAHFRADGLVLHAVTPHEWVIAADRPVDFAAPPTRQVHGRSVEAHLPSGPDGRTLRRLATEAQMLLHAATVNEDRGARGRPLVNGLWLWGAGASPPRVAAQAWTILSGSSHLRGLAAAAQAEHVPLPEDTRTLDRLTGHVLLDLDGRLDDPREWVERLAGIWLDKLSRLSVRMHVVVNLPDCSASAGLFRFDPWRALRRGGLARSLEKHGIQPADETT